MSVVDSASDPFVDVLMAVDVDVALGDADVLVPGPELKAEKLTGAALVPDPKPKLMAGNKGAVELVGAAAALEA